MNLEHIKKDYTTMKSALDTGLIIYREQLEAACRYLRLPEDTDFPEIMKRINTKFDYPPIPIRSMDYSAYFEDHEEGCYGHGPTRDAAILALFEIVEVHA